MSENTVLVRALADLAYSIALADGKLEEQEKNAFNPNYALENMRGVWT